MWCGPRLMGQTTVRLACANGACGHCSTPCVTGEARAPAASTKRSNALARLDGRVAAGGVVGGEAVGLGNACEGVQRRLFMA